MLSHGLAKATGILAVCLAVCGTASAQYGGGGSTGGTGTGIGSTNHTGSYSSGSGKAIGIGVGAAAGAAVGIALLLHHHHAAASKEASVVGCTQSMMDGITLKNEKDDLTYTIVPSNNALHAGERVELNGVVFEDKAGVHSFQVHSLVNDYGSCGLTSAMADAETEKKKMVAEEVH